MPNHILFLFEGIKTEKQIFSSMEQFFLNESESILISLYGTNIYGLYQEMSNDEFIDLFQLLKDKPENKTTLSNISRDEVSEIYLFFDYDGHTRSASNETLKDALIYFDNETENGKLYISYPMVEALKHIERNVDFKNTVAKSCRKYKKFVRDHCYEQYMDITTLNQTQWQILINLHCCKLNYLINDEFEMPNQEISQLIIFERQLAQYIEPRNQVAVLSAFPIFLIDYYGCQQLQKKLIT